jgi:hypothetical protein
MTNWESPRHFTRVLGREHTGAYVAFSALLLSND